MLPGKLDLKTTNDADGLTGLLNKPPTIQRDLQPLSSEQFSGFRLKPGRLEDHRNPLFTGQKKKKKRREHVDGEGEITFCSKIASKFLVTPESLKGVF